MAKLMNLRSFVSVVARVRPQMRSVVRRSSSALIPGNQEKDTVTHTGQVFQDDDYRRSRYLDCDKYVNTRFAIDLIKEQPVVVCAERVVISDGGGPLGHPRVYINLDQPGYHTCGYSGRRFVLKKNYDEKSMGPSITYDQYLEEIGQLDD